MIREAFLPALLATLLLPTGGARAAEAPAASALPADPLASPMWEYHARRLFAGAPVRFDERVRVAIPAIAENQRVFPVTVDARAVPGVVRIVLLADLNPIPVAVDYAPSAAAPYLATLPADPLASPMWEYHARRLFAGAPVRFDERVRVAIPAIAENQRVFPVTVDARAVPGVVRIVLLADLNPIPVAVDYAPSAAAPYLATRIKLDQRTPVRAAVLTADGVWHVGGAWIDAAGGGCSAPPVSRVRGDWAEHLGEMRGAAWRERDGGTRLRVTVRHPMDTGLVENIPAYNIERLAVASAAGRPLAELQVFGSVAEDPAFTLLVEDAGPVRVTARDSGGLEFSGTLAAAAAPAPKALATR